MREIPCFWCCVGEEGEGPEPVLGFGTATRVIRANNGVLRPVCRAHLDKGTDEHYGMLRGLKLYLIELVMRA